MNAACVSSPSSALKAHGDETPSMRAQTHKKGLMGGGVVVIVRDSPGGSDGRAFSSLRHLQLQLEQENLSQTVLSHLSSVCCWIHAGDPDWPTVRVHKEVEEFRVPLEGHEVELI